MRPSYSTLLGSMCYIALIRMTNPAAMKTSMPSQPVSPLLPGYDADYDLTYMTLHNLQSALEDRI